jgi:hypothetical protein
MKREDWKVVADKLCWPGASVHLRVDGKNVTLQVGTDKMKMVIMVFVDGWMRGEWLNVEKPCPEQAFMCRRETYLWGKKERDAAAKYAKRYGKIHALRVYGDMDKKFVCFSPFFPSVPRVRAHYEKTFKSIELVTE